MRTPPSSRAERAHDILRHVPRPPLESLFAPRSVAVIGATEKEGSVGRAVLENLRDFPGKVFPINPKRASVLGRPTLPSVAAAPETVDLAVIVTPAPTVPGIIRECSDAGVPAAVIISAGFKECGPAGAELEAQVLAEARRGGMRVIGPNCLGVMAPHGRFNATFAAAMAHPGSVAFISQSGALCTAILDWSLKEHVGFSAFVSIGSMLDVNWGDLITHFGDDPHTRSIVCYMESVGDARAFLSATREVAFTKPIIVLKVGRTDAAAKAAASHTGALTGSDAVLDAAFRRAGVLRVNNVEELFDMAEVLGKQPRPRGPRLAVITNAGGPGALATDALVEAGGQLAPLAAGTVAALNELLPPHWSHGNPIDVLGDADAARYAKAVEIVAKDPGNDGLLVVLTPQAMTNAAATAEALKPFAKLAGKPMLASWMGAVSVDHGVKILNEAGVPTFAYPDRAARAFDYMWRYADNLRALYETPAIIPSDAGSEPGSESPRPGRLARADADAMISAARKAGRTLLTELESKQLLASHGIPTVETLLAKTEDEAVHLAGKLGYPVVLKLHSEIITHKTEVGGVQLGLGDADAVRRAWQTIRRNVAAVAKPSDKLAFLGVTVQRMIPLEGYELILGSSIDPQFGPVLLFGAGGQLVEVFKDHALGLPPLNSTLARRLMERTRVFTALQGVRGRRSVDLAALEHLLVRFSQLVVEQPWIAELDINPLLASPERLLALDARVLLHPAGMREEELPHPAIRPYPAQYMQPWKLRDGTTVGIRPIRPEDEALMVRFHQTLSERSVYARYFAPLQLEQRVAHERLSRLCFIDYDREMALVVEHPGSNGQREIIGVGRLSKLHGRSEAEFALTIGDQWQNHGLGTQLLRMLVQVGRDEKLERITAIILGDNHEMQHVARKAGFTMGQEPGTHECRAELVL